MVINSKGIRRTSNLWAYETRTRHYQIHVHKKSEERMGGVVGWRPVVKQHAGYHTHHRLFENQTSMRRSVIRDNITGMPERMRDKSRVDTRVSCITTHLCVPDSYWQNLVFQLTLHFLSAHSAELLTTAQDVNETRNFEHLLQSWPVTFKERQPELVPVPRKSGLKQTKSVLKRVARLVARTQKGCLLHWPSKNFNHPLFDRPWKSKEHMNVVQTTANVQTRQEEISSRPLARWRDQLNETQALCINFLFTFHKA